MHLGWNLQLLITGGDGMVNLQNMGNGHPTYIGYTNTTIGYINPTIWVDDHSLC